MVRRGPARGGIGNVLQGDFGESWLHVVAAGAEMLHGDSNTVDLDKADVEITWQGHHGNTYSPCVKAQVKTTSELRLEDEHFLYDLDVSTYEVLRRTDHAVGRVLVVLRVSDRGERIDLQDGGTLLRGEGAWVSLEGEPATHNDSTVTVRLPRRNTLERTGLERMLLAHGTRRTTQVPEYELWKGEA